MKYSKATNYALHTVLFLALDKSKALVSVQELAEKQNVSPTYLSKILTKLVKEGIVNSSPGVNGGYSLGANWEEISFLDIIHTIEGKSSLFDCYCVMSPSECDIKKVMTSAENLMESELRNQKISELAKKIQAREN